MSEYTKGPWGIEQTEDTNWIGFMRPDGIKVELIVCTTDRYLLTPAALKQNDANARLISAAPELLEVLQYLVAPFDGIEVVSDGLIAKARAAIEKAVAAPSAPIR